MKERPLILDGESVCAILDGRKTQLRKPLKPQPVNPKWDGKVRPGDGAPYLPGTRLWVRETADFLAGDEFLSPKDRCVVYRADGENRKRYNGSWCSPLLMPRWASRLTLEITDVRAQRVQEISDEDAAAEGWNKDALGNAIDPLLQRANPVDAYWPYDGDDDREGDFCLKCVNVEVQKLKDSGKENAQPSGGWESDHDHLLFCDTCGVLMAGSFTDYATQSEIAHYRENGFGKGVPSDAYAVSNILGSGSASDSDIAALGFRFGARATWKANPWVWAITFRVVP